MHLKYKETKSLIEVKEKTSKHTSPHLHDALEIIYITKGTLELGMGQELYHMDEGDLGIIFPDVIHHSQVFSSGENLAVHMNVPTSIIGMLFSEEVQKMAPKCPVLQKNNIDQEVVDAIYAIIRANAEDVMIIQAYVQIILARCLPKYELVEKTSVGSTDLIYQTVSYIAAHFRESISLESMAFDLGVSKYMLSRVFSGTFHQNFNQYLNEARLSYACKMMEETNRTILDIAIESGFESQRTFNRVFKEKYRVTPSEYRLVRREFC